MWFSALKRDYFDAFDFVPALHLTRAVVLDLSNKFHALHLYGMGMG